MKPSTPAWKADQPEEIDELLPAERADPFGTIGAEVRFIGTLFATSRELKAGADADTDAANGAAWAVPDMDVLLLVAGASWSVPDVDVLLVAGARLDAAMAGVMVSASPS